MAEIRGVVEKINMKPRGKGKSWGLLINGEWRNVFTRDDLNHLLNADVSLTEAENAKGFVDVDPKSIRIHSEKPPAQTRAQAAAGASASPSAGAPSAPSRGPAANGARIGMAINCSTLLIAHGIVKPAAGQQVSALVEAVAKSLVALAVRLENAEVGGVVVPAPIAPPVAPQPPPPTPVAAPVFDDADIPF